MKYLISLIGLIKSFVTPFNNPLSRMIEYREVHKIKVKQEEESQNIYKLHLPRNFYEIRKKNREEIILGIDTTSIATKFGRKAKRLKIRRVWSLHSSKSKLEFNT